MTTALLRSTCTSLIIAGAIALPACKREQVPEPNAPAAAQVTADTSAQPARSTDEPAPEAAPVAPAPVAILPAAFVDKVWKVSDSSTLEPGTTYAFLADGTLVVDSPGGTPMVGRWTFVDGALTMIEEGVSYPTDIVKLDAGEFRLLSHNPGEPVEIALVPAPDVPLPKAAPPKP